jgi:site-specific recombinase XerD
MKTNNEFPRILSNFLLNELTVVQNQSNNTITSYRDTYKRLLGYMQDRVKICPDKLRVEDLTVERITEFLNWLEYECGNSISTRNQRLAAIHSLFRYIQLQAPEYAFQCQQVLAIRSKKAQKKQVGFLSENEIQALLAVPDTKTQKGRRDQTLLTLLYDSAARVQELADLCVGDLRLDPPAQVTLFGKGRKTRGVPLMTKTVALLQNYLQEHRLDRPSCYEHPLFFNTQRKKLSRQAIAYLLQKYADECGIRGVSPHLIRHTKAMHLTEADMNPIYIRDFLGHKDLKVTEIYSKTSIKMKLAALDKMNSGKHDVLPEITNDWTQDKGLMAWLTGQQDDSV